MKLLGVEKSNDCLYSEWCLTYRVGWGHICSAASLIFQYTEDPDVTVGDANGETEIEAASADDLANLDESGWLSISGTSEILHVPVFIQFYNQTDYVRVYVRSVTDEFKEADYKNFNLSMCQFMDSIELAMYH